jgi:Tol biopolymer transport system component
MTRQTLVAVLALAAVLVGAAPGAGPKRVSPRTLANVALPSPLPAGWTVFDSNRCPGTTTTCTATQEWEVYARDTSGNIYQVTSDARYDSWWPKLSPDRKRILFIRTDAGEKEQDWSKNSLWDVSVDGSAGPTKLVGSANGIAAGNPYAWTFQGHEEWSPLGDAIATIATTAGRTLQIYVLLFNSTTNTVSTPYQVSHGSSGTSDRPGTNIDPSWNPDSGSVLFVGCAVNAARTACDATKGGSQELILTPNTLGYGTELQRTTTTDGTLNFDPYFSPNGTQIAWLHEDNCNVWDIRHATPLGNNLSTVLNDGAVNSKPAWTSDSATVYFHRYGSIERTLWSIGSGGGAATQLTLGSQDVRCSASEPSNDSGAPGTPLGPNPTVPATSVVFASNRCVVTPCTQAGNWEIYRRDSDGSVHQLTSAPTYDSFQPEISPNRSAIMFLRSPKGNRRDSLDYSLWIVKADGTAYGASPALTTGGAFVRFDHPRWSFDGNEVVFDASTAAQEAKGPGPDENNQIYWMQYVGSGALGASAYQATWGAGGTGDRPGNNVEPSWNPDGGSILFVGCTLNAGRTACDGVHSTGDVQLISSTMHTVDVPRTSTTDGTSYADPVESPNGTYIAAAHALTCTSASLVRMNSDGSAPTTLLNDGSLVGRPTWSSASTTIYFDKLPANVGPTIWKINPNAPSPPGPNGTGLTQVTGTAGSQTPCGTEYPNLG